MTKIGIIGDLHGNSTWGKFALRVLNERGIKTVFQVGDFGVYNTHWGQIFAKEIQATLEEFGMTLYVAPGNHEDYDFIESIPVEADGLQHLRKNILLAPRGYRQDFDGKTVLFLGGAPSVDRWYRTEVLKGKHWWAQEALTHEDVQKVVEGGPADVMVTHDAPLGSPTVERSISGNPHGFVEDDLAYAYEGRVRMHKAFMAAQPKLFLHGHYHFLCDDVWNVPSGPNLRDIKFQTHMLGLDCDSKNYSVGQFDTETLEAEAFNLWNMSVE